jgi:hypothetical protein
MGQYHQVYNTTKKEFLCGHDLDNGLKLVEQVAWSGSTSTALFALLANSNGKGGGDFPEHDYIGRWAGDNIVIQGDYAQEGDQAYIPEAELESYANISEPVLEMLKLIVKKIG